MSNSNHPYWFYFNLALLALVAIVVIVITRYQSPFRTTIAGVDNYWQQEAGYIAGLAAPMTNLRGLLVLTLTPEQAAPLESIRQQLLGLRVPSGYQDFHLQLILKISQLEELLTDSGYNAPISQAAIARLQTELGESLAEYDNFNK